MLCNRCRSCRIVWAFAFALLGALKAKAAEGLTGWTLENAALKVTISPSDFGISVRDKRIGVTWDSIDTGTADIEAAVGGKGWYPKLVGAEVGKVEPVHTPGHRGLRVRVGKTQGEPAHDFGVWFEYTLAEKDPSLRVQILPAIKATDYTLGWLHYPRPFAIERSPESYYIMPYFQGAIVPGNWPTKFREGWPLNTSSFTMPWFGAVRGRAGMIALVDTPYDAWLVAQNSEGGPPTVGVHWSEAFQYVTYPRSVTFEFLTDATYVTLAKRYRRYAMQVNGRYRSWADKVRKIPQAKSLPGRTAIEITFIMNHDVRTKPPIHVVQRTFDQAAQELQTLYDGGWRNILAHVDGWGQRGYDNLHPDVIPPCPEAGGYEGLARYVAKAKQLGYVIELHDNYWDYYLDAPSFSEQYTVKGTDGQSPRYSSWAGGMQSLLCGKRALQFVKRNMEALNTHRALPGSLYFDTFDAAALDECFDPTHRMTRDECARERNRCFDYTTAMGMLCASEGGSDWSIPHTTHVNTVAITGVGVQVPLYSLVYHDATIAYGWIWDRVSELQCALHTFAPRVQPFVWKPWQEAVDRIADLSKRLAGVEMTNHRFLNEQRTLQETTFANGATVEVDFEKRRYRVTGLKGLDTGWRDTLIMGFPVRVRVVRFEPLKGRQFSMTFEWETKGKLPLVTHCFVHFIHPLSERPGGIVAGLDHALPHSADQWTVGQRILDGPYTTSLPDDGPTGEYSVIIGLLCPAGYKLPERLPLYWDTHTPSTEVVLGKLIVSRESNTPLRFEPTSTSSW